MKVKTAPLLPPDPDEWWPSPSYYEWYMRRDDYAEHGHTLYDPTKEQKANQS